MIVENELQRDDNEKLLNQYEREKQARKDTELVILLKLKIKIFSIVITIKFIFSFKEIISKRRLFC